MKKIEMIAVCVNCESAIYNNEDYLLLDKKEPLCDSICLMEYMDIEIKRGEA